jgi:hypothetical protein
MAIRRDTLSLIRDLRRAVLTLADDQIRKLVEAWARAWDGMDHEMQAAVADLLAVGEGQWPTRAQIARATRAQRALVVAETQLEQLAIQAGVDLGEAATAAVRLAAEWNTKIIASQFPPSASDKVTLAATFDRVDPAAIQAIVERTTQQITSLLWPLASDATESMKRALVRGVAVGDNPRTVARRMLRTLEGEFNGGLQRAMVVARTEILDAHRAGAQAQQSANTDVLAGWLWHAELSARTCPSCWAKHGTLHPVAEPGPLDHQQGRCSRMPKTKSWADLGFGGVSEPPDLVPDAKTVFDQLPRRDQLQIMGLARLEALQNGDIAWADLTKLRTTPGWRDSWAPAPLKDLLSK